MVVDGDNLFARARAAGLDIVWEQFLQDLRQRLHVTTPELFVTYRNEDVLDYWSNVCKKARYYYEPQRLRPERPKGQRGYPDSLLIDGVRQQIENYDRFVIVSSDTHFWPLLGELRQADKQTVLVGHYLHADRQRRPVMIADEFIELGWVLPCYTTSHQVPQRIYLRQLRLLQMRSHWHQEPRRDDKDSRQPSLSPSR